MIRTIVATPIAIPLHRNDDTFRTVSMNWAILFEPELSYPVRLSSWPRMIDTATALTNPVRTAWETNRARRPTRRIPPTRRTRPVRRVRQARIAGSLGLSAIAGTSAMITAIALVDSTLISADDVDNDPTVRPIR